jgi:hypothetical protein
MDANKMPRMPDYLSRDLSHMTGGGLIVEVEAYGLACYLAGLEAAKACVGEAVTYTDLKGPEPHIPEHNAYNRGVAEGMNGRRDTTLANIAALEKEAGK